MANSNLAINVQAKLITMECYKCCILFAVPNDFEDRRRKDHTGFYCPSGHCQSFTSETEEERLLKEAVVLRNRLATATKTARIETNRRLLMERRIRQGVCPKCKRSFSNVKRHMETKHKKKEAKK